MAAHALARIVVPIEDMMWFMLSSEYQQDLKSLTKSGQVKFCCSQEVCKQTVGAIERSLQMWVDSLY